MDVSYKPDAQASAYPLTPEQATRERFAHERAQTALRHAVRPRNRVRGQRCTRLRFGLVFKSSPGRL